MSPGCARVNRERRDRRAAVPAGWSRRASSSQGWSSYCWSSWLALPLRPKAPELPSPQKPGPLPLLRLAWAQGTFRWIGGVRRAWRTARRKNSGEQQRAGGTKGRSYHVGRSLDSSSSVSAAMCGTARVRVGTLDVALALCQHCHENNRDDPYKLPDNTPETSQKLAATPSPEAGFTQVG